MEPVLIGDIPIGDGHASALMAEIGTFFNKDIDMACALIKASVDAGAPIVKSEILHDPDVCIKDAGLLVAYNHAMGSKEENYRALVERKVVPLERYRVLYDFCRELGVPFVASVYDVEGIDFLVDVGGAGIKFGAHQMNNIPLLRYAAATGLPVLIDAARCQFHELARMVHEAQGTGAGGVIVMHHPGANPAPPNRHHLHMIEKYKVAFQVPVGLTCHYRGDEILYAAIGAGANVLEKGVIDNPDRVEIDLVSAAAIEHLPEVVRKVNHCWQALGEEGMEPRESGDLSSRKGLVAKRPLSSGERLSLDNIQFSWPPLGIHAEYWDLVVGRPITRTLHKNEVIRWKDVDLDFSNG